MPNESTGNEVHLSDDEVMQMPYLLKMYEENQIL